MVGDGQTEVVEEEGRHKTRCSHVVGVPTEAPKVGRPDGSSFANQSMLASTNSLRRQENERLIGEKQGNQLIDWRKTSHVQQFFCHNFSVKIFLVGMLERCIRSTHTHTHTHRMHILMFYLFVFI
jgi:hypothetical protein